MAEAHNHHYIPQCYLREFAKKSGKRHQVFTINLGNGKIFTTSVRNVGAIRDFNKIEYDDIHPNMLEMKYAKIEDDIAVALQKISETRLFTSTKIRDPLLFLMTLLSIRHPNFRKKIDDFTTQFAQRMINLNLEHSRNQNTPDSIRSGEYTIAAPRIGKSLTRLRLLILFSSRCLLAIGCCW